MRAGTDAKTQELIEQHLPLVRHVVFQVAVHFPRHVDREELATAGALGLVEAARRYDEARGVPFDRFAAQRIRGAILDAVRAADWAPRSVRTLARKLEPIEQRLATDLGRVPTAEETAEALGVSQRGAQPPPGPHVPLGRARPRARGERRRRGPDPGRRARRRRARSSRARSSRTASCTPTCATPCTCCPSATASWSSATSSRAASPRSWPASSA